MKTNLLRGLATIVLLTLLPTANAITISFGPQQSATTFDATFDASDLTIQQDFRGWTFFRTPTLVLDYQGWHIYAGAAASGSGMFTLTGNSNVTSAGTLCYGYQLSELASDGDWMLGSGYWNTGGVWNLGLVTPTLTRLNDHAYHIAWTLPQVQVQIKAASAVPDGGSAVAMLVMALGVVVFTRRLV